MGNSIGFKVRKVSVQKNPEISRTEITDLNVSELKMETDKEDDSVFNLTPIQKQIILDTWNLIDDKRHFIIQILSRIFAAKPVLKSLFNLENVSSDQLHENRVFLNHTKKFGDYINFQVLNLSDPKRGIEVAKKIGQDHLKYCKDIKFDYTNLNTFVDSFVVQVENEQKQLGGDYFKTKMTTNIKEAWTIFMKGMIEVMRLSYYMAKQKSDLGNTVN